MFDLRKYLGDNFLLNEGSKAKDDYFARQRRLEQGNWKESIGQYVEKHGQDIENALKAGQLRNFVTNNMKPELGPEAQEYIDNLLTTCKSPMKLLTALYNVTMKGSGLGLNEESNKPSISTILQELDNLLGWGETLETYIGNGEGAIITFNVDPMAYFTDDDQIKDVNQFAQKYGVDVIPFFYNTEGESGGPWEYDVLASGFIVRSSSNPCVYEDSEELTELGMSELEEFIDESAKKESV